MKPRMVENFDLLLPRILDTLDKSDLETIRKQLDIIKTGQNIVVGSGGSAVVAMLASKILGGAIVRSSRDVNYMDLSRFNNILIASYSGRGLTVENLLDKDKEIYLLTNGQTAYQGVNYIYYASMMEKERSFISLASTLMPMSILLWYYLQMDLDEFKKLIGKIFDTSKDISIGQEDVYEIFGGEDTKAACKYLDSTMVEAGLAVPLVHDKYDFCHGRSTLAYHSNHSCIYFNGKTELDKIIHDELVNYYKDIVTIDSQFDDSVVKDYEATVKAMYLTRQLAMNKNLDLSLVQYAPIVKKLYHFKGGM